MAGPTGVGKTEIARRLAKFVGAPFIKVEATKFTEVGFHGRDVDQIIKDLVAVGISETKKALREQKAREKGSYAEGRLLDALIGKTSPDVRDYFAEKLTSGALDDHTVRITIKVEDKSDKEGQAQQVIIKALRPPQSIQKVMTVKEALEYFQKEDEDHVTTEDIVTQAIKNVEENGIVFIDEIDKVCRKKGNFASDGFSEGVQRDLLPLVEGCVINTKHGDVDTSKILFIASGAFYATKPSDLLPELQGRLPVRVNLEGLDEKDMRQILTEPQYNLLVQQQELMKCDGINLIFKDEAIDEIATQAVTLNRTVENIGARRLHTIIERLTAEMNFECKPGEIVVDAATVKECVKPLFEKTDLSRYII